jgi:hypothetical protein
MSRQQRLPISHFASLLLSRAGTCFPFVTELQFVTLLPCLFRHYFDEVGLLYQSILDRDTAAKQRIELPPDPNFPGLRRRFVAPDSAYNRARKQAHATAGNALGSVKGRFGKACVPWNTPHPHKEMVVRICIRPADTAPVILWSLLGNLCYQRTWDLIPCVSVTDWIQLFGWDHPGLCRVPPFNVQADKQFLDIDVSAEVWEPERSETRKVGRQEAAVINAVRDLERVWRRHGWMREDCPDPVPTCIYSTSDSLGRIRYLQTQHCAGARLSFCLDASLTGLFLHAFNNYLSLTPGSGVAPSGPCHGGREPELPEAYYRTYWTRIYETWRWLPDLIPGQYGHYFTIHPDPEGPVELYSLGPKTVDELHALIALAVEKNYRLIVL